MDIKEIPQRELIYDRMETKCDIAICEAALAFGIESYKYGSVQERLDTNLKIVAKIDAELARRAGKNKSPRKELESCSPEE